MQKKKSWQMKHKNLIRLSIWDKAKDLRIGFLMSINRDAEVKNDVRSI